MRKKHRRKVRSKSQAQSHRKPVSPKQNHAIPAGSIQTPEEAHAPWNLTTIPSLIAISIIGFVTHIAGLGNNFIYEDISQIVNNPVVHSISNLGRFFGGSTFYVGGQGSTHLVGEYYRPLMTTTFSLLYSVFGPNPFYFHLFQLFLFIGAAILIYLFFESIFHPILSLAFSLIFLVHPLESQVVYYISSLQDALFVFFGMLGLIILCRYKSFRSLFVVAACLVLSLLSKESGVLFVGMAILYLYWFDKDRLWSFIKILSLPFLVYVVLRIHAVGLSAHSSLTPADNLNLLGKLYTAPSVLIFYFFKLIFPLKLSVGYYWAYSTFSVMHVLIPLLFGIVIVSLASYGAKIVRSKSSNEMFVTYLFFAIWASIGFLPVLPIIPLDLTASETWFQFSLIGILGMLGVILITFQSRIRRNWFYLIVALLVIVLGTRTFIRGKDWSSLYQLAVTSIAANKDDFVAYTSLATVYGSQGDYYKAEQYAQRSVDIFPSHDGYLYLGRAQASLKDYADAEKTYISGLPYGGRTIPYIEEDLSTLFLVYGNPAANKTSVHKFINIFPQDSTLWENLSVLDANTGDPSDAKAAIAKAAEYGQVPQAMYDSIMNNVAFTINEPDLNAIVNVQ